MGLPNSLGVHTTNGTDITYHCQPDKNGKTKQREIGYERWAIKKAYEVFERASGFRYDAEDGDEDGAAGDEESTEKHPWREDVAEENTSKERVPKEGDCAEGGENDDW